MGTSVFSFLMSLIWCSVFLLLSVAWHQMMMLKHGTGFALMAISVGIIRLVLPLDLPLSIIIRSESIMPTVQRFFDVTAFMAFKFQVDRFDVLIGVWMVGSIIYLICIATNVLKCKRFLKHMQKRQNAQADKIMGEIVSTSKIGKRYHIWVSDEIKTPMLAGYFSPTILLPPLKMPDTELRYIILHEWNHFLHKHLWIKLLFNVFCAILWWNPLVYMTKADLDYILEVNCDRYVVQSFGENGRAEYVKAMVDTMKQLTDSAIHRPKATVGFVGMVGNKTIRRCELILSPSKLLGRWAKSALSLVIVAVIVLSYSFILQPFIPPQVDDESLSITSANSFLYKTGENTYTVIIDGQYQDTISTGDLGSEPYASLPIINRGG